MQLYALSVITTYVIMWVVIFLTRNNDGFFYRLVTTYESHFKLLIANALVLPSLALIIHAILQLVNKDYAKDIKQITIERAKNRKLKSSS